jgi:hypothetical protein
LKEGTLEEAAQALEQLELKESEAEKTKEVYQVNMFTFVLKQQFIIITYRFTKIKIKAHQSTHFKNIFITRIFT